jgi:hypothetical protein
MMRSEPTREYGRRILRISQSCRHNYDSQPGRIDVAAKIVRLPVLVAFLFLLYVIVDGGAPRASTQVPPQNVGARVATAIRADRAPRLDGTLEDPVWNRASPLRDFRQREPLETLSCASFRRKLDPLIALFGQPVSWLTSARISSARVPRARIETDS